VNHQLAKSENYSGKIGDVSVHLWRGAYSIQNIQIFKKSGKIREPFFAATNFDLALEWKELFHGALVGEIRIYEPRLNFVSGPTPETTQAGEKTSWGKTLESLFPFQFNRVEISDGQIHYQDHFSKPPVDIYFNQLSAVATNLSNSRNLKEELPGGIIAQAKTVGDGKMNFNLRLNPVAKNPEFQLQMDLTNVDLTALNDFLRAYGKFDVARGNFSMFTSFAVKDKNYEGYVKVLFRNLDVFEWQKERKKNALAIFWEAIVGTLTEAFRNQPHDLLATKIPISGSYGNTQLGVWTAAMNLLHNAFVRALVPKLDQKVTVQDVSKKISNDETTTNSNNSNKK
jgi:hypothetical protein